MAATTSGSAPCEGAGAPEWRRQGGALFCEDVDVAELARRYGTPLYVYSAGVVRGRLRELRAADEHERRAVIRVVDASLL